VSFFFSVCASTKCFVFFLSFCLYFLWLSFHLACFYLSSNCADSSCFLFFLYFFSLWLSFPTLALLYFLFICLFVHSFNFLSDVF
jgi:hypothetical protein